MWLEQKLLKSFELEEEPRLQAQKPSGDDEEIKVHFTKFQRALRNASIDEEKEVTMKKSQLTIHDMFRRKDER